MSLNFRFYIDGELMTDGPDNWQDFDIAITYNEEMRGRSRTYATALQFSGEDYTTIETLFRNNTFDAQLPFLAQYQANYGAWTTFMTGYITPSQCELLVHQRIVSVTIEDDAFEASVFNNKDVRIPTQATTCIDGVTAITPVTSVSVNLVNRAGDTYGDRRVRIAEYADMMTFIIKYLTNDNIEYADDWYPSLDDYSLATGQFIGIGNHASLPTPTLKGLWTTVAKLYNLYFDIVVESGQAKFKVFEYTDYYTSTSVVTIDSDTDIKIYIMQDRAYGAVTVGDNASDDATFVDYVSDAGGSLWLSFVSKYLTDGLFGFEPFTYRINTPIGGNTILDLTTPYGYKINSSVVTGQSQDTYFLLQYTESATAESGYALINQELDDEVTVYIPWLLFDSDGVTTDGAYSKSDQIISESFGQVPGLPALQNGNILSRYDFIADIVTPTENRAALSLAPRMFEDFIITADEMAADTFYTLPLISGSQQYGDSLIFSNTEHCFIVTQANDGYTKYNLPFRGRVVKNNISVSDADVVMLIRVQMDGTFYEYPIGDAYMGVLGIYTGELLDTNNLDINEIQIQLKQGAKVWLGFRFEDIVDFGTIELEFTDSVNYFDVESAAVTATTIATGSPDTVKMYGIDFDTHITMTEWLALFDSPNKAVTINNGDDVHKGWVRDVRYNPNSGRFAGTLITDGNNLFT